MRFQDIPRGSQRFPEVPSSLHYRRDVEGQSALNEATWAKGPENLVNGTRWNREGLKVINLAVLGSVANRLSGHFFDHVGVQAASSVLQTMGSTLKVLPVGKEQCCF